MELGLCHHFMGREVLSEKVVWFMEPYPVPPQVSKQFLRLQPGSATTVPECHVNSLTLETWEWDIPEMTLNSPLKYEVTLRFFMVSPVGSYQHCRTQLLKTLTSPASLLEVPHQPVRTPEQHSKLGGFPAEGQASATKPATEETIPLLQIRGSGVLPLIFFHTLFC